MTKRIGSLLLALIMTVSLAVPAMAVTAPEQTEGPTASTVEPTAPADADTTADTSASTPEETPAPSTSTPEETPAPSETEKDTDSKEKKTEAQKAVAPLAATPTVAEYLADLPLTADLGSATSTVKWTTLSLDGETVLTSGNKGKASASSTLTLTTTADTHLTFQYKVSTEANYDKFTITHNSTTVVNGVSGLVDWTLVELDVATGDTLTFTYKKDSSGDKNDDRVYLHNFTVGAGIPITFHAHVPTTPRTSTAARAP